jgi:hypothetical protein
MYESQIFECLRKYVVYMSDGNILQNPAVLVGVGWIRYELYVGHAVCDSS